jgi:hypothetical protein
MPWQWPCVKLSGAAACSACMFPYDNLYPSRRLEQHGADKPVSFPTLDELRLFMDALRLLVSGYSIFRGRKPEPGGQAGEEERAIDEAIRTAETEIEVPGADSERVGRELEERLEAKLGPQAKDAIIKRALGIMALAHPYEMKSFRYYEVLEQLLSGTRAFFLANNVFKLRGEAEDGGRFLPLGKFSAVLKRLLERSGYFGRVFRADRDVLDVSVEAVFAMPRTESEGSDMAVSVKAKKSDHMADVYSDGYLWAFKLVPGTEVNRIGFHVERHPQYHYSNDFDMRITLQEFQDLALAALGDLNDYASELADEERSFKEELGPALNQALALIGQNLGG